MANAMARWAQGGYLNEIGTTSGSTVSLSDAHRDIAVVPASSSHLSGAVGKTFLAWSGCNFERGDILISDAFTFAQPNDTLPADPLPANGGQFQDGGWAAFLHEFGHLLGLSNNYWNDGVNYHSTLFATMRPSLPLPTFGNPNTAQATAPDDEAGFRALARFGVNPGPGGWPAVRNVASTQTKLSGSVVPILAQPSPFNPQFPFVARCRGGTISLPFNTANHGTVAVTINHRVYIRKFGEGDPYDAFHPDTRQITQWVGANHNPENSFQLTNTATVPCGTPAGLYSIMHFADSGFQVSEYNEQDNTSMYPIILSVDNCGC